jgi:hypothetical protein
MTREILEQTLKDLAIDLSQGKKSCEDLWKEIASGESVVYRKDNELIRQTRTVVAIIEDPIRGLLLEDYQILPNGKKKEIKHPPAGKLLINEDPRAGLERELLQELGLSTTDYDCSVFEAMATEIEEIESSSYPQLRCQYEVHRFIVRLKPWVDIEDGFNVLDVDGKRLFFKWSRHNLVAT